MPNFYFHLRTPDHIRHHGERHELPNLREAMIVAQGAARSLVRKQVRHGQLRPCGSLDIEDETHQPLARIVLAELARQLS